MMDLFNSALGKNITFVRPAYFIISGFSGILNINYYFVFLFFVYIISVLGNTTVMAVIFLDHNLRAPKYIAVCNLAFVDLCSSTALVPKVIDVFLFNHPFIPYGECMTFLFFCYACVSMQSFNLVILSYDRLMAIFYPLHYQVKMTHRFIFSLIAFFWLFVIAVMFIVVGLLTRLSFCGSVVIKSYFCDHGPIYRLACNDNRPNKVLSLILPVLILWFPLFFILLTYSFISYSLAKITKAGDRLKAFKTCTAHLSIVSLYYLPVIATFMFGGRLHANTRIINLSLGSVVPPMLNPIIYALQTREIKESLKKLLRIRGRSKNAMKI
ncbi:olfactory receptor 1E16-like [Genypterus blacodes]|uniref:olfactory receptor 1E16-like n=1 Tax=Genypterus blacodes TaxID=154954 RepID=UPI003F75DBA5